MAEYYTRFCCTLPVGTAENASRALALYEAMAGAAYVDEDGAIGFEAAADPTRPGDLILHDGNGYGEPESVAGFALRCAEELGLRGRWGFAWAHTCSKPRLDGFGGGALILDFDAREIAARIDCDGWLAAKLVPGAVLPTDPVAEISSLLHARSEQDRGTILREAGRGVGLHVLAMLEEPPVREEVRELVENSEEAASLPDAAVDGLDLRAACQRAADHTDLSEEVGAARFRAAVAAIGAAEARCAGSRTLAAG